MIEMLKRAFERAALIMQTLDADARWDALLANSLTPEALDLLAAEALDEDDAGVTEEITGDGVLS